METTNFLLELMKHKTHPGELPSVDFSQLIPVENNLSMHLPEMVLHLACSFNEPAIVSYVLDRYQLDPNKELEGVQYDTYTYMMMFACDEVIDVLLQRKLYPTDWYVFLLFLHVNESLVLMDQVLTDHASAIKLSPDECRKLRESAPNPSLLEFLVRTYGSSLPPP